MIPRTNQPENLADLAQWILFRTFGCKCPEKWFIEVILNELINLYPYNMVALLPRFFSAPIYYAPSLYFSVGLCVGQWANDIHTYVLTSYLNKSTYRTCWNTQVAFCCKCVKATHLEFILLGNIALYRHSKCHCQNTVGSDSLSQQAFEQKSYVMHVTE